MKTTRHSSEPGMLLDMPHAAYPTVGGLALSQ
jgi:hypothetical protein